MHIHKETPYGINFLFLTSGTEIMVVRRCFRKMTNAYTIQAQGVIMIPKEDIM
jgi:hypothetical protein